MFRNALATAQKQTHYMFLYFDKMAKGAERDNCAQILKNQFAQLETYQGKRVYLYDLRPRIDFIDFCNALSKVKKTDIKELRFKPDPHADLMKSFAELQKTPIETLFIEQKNCSHTLPWGEYLRFKNLCLLVDASTLKNIKEKKFNNNLFHFLRGFKDKRYDHINIRFLTEDQFSQPQLDVNDLYLYQKATMNLSVEEIEEKTKGVKTYPKIMMPQKKSILPGSILQHQKLLNEPVLLVQPAKMELESVETDSQIPDLSVKSQEETESQLSDFFMDTTEETKNSGVEVKNHFPTLLLNEEEEEEEEEVVRVFDLDQEAKSFASVMLQLSQNAVKFAAPKAITISTKIGLFPPAAGSNTPVTGKRKAEDQLEAEKQAKRFKTSI